VKPQMKKVANRNQNALRRIARASVPKESARRLRRSGEGAASSGAAP
jgi:hypothetical protein